MPKVSVLMPVYNTEKYLEKAIHSIQSQTFEDWELIIVNDGSTDGSRSILEQFKDSRIFCIDNGTNLGLIKTLNKGVEFCNGDFIARMDADDIALPFRLEKQVLFMEQNPDYLMCGTNALVVDNSEKVTGRIRNLADNRFLQINLLFSNPFIHPSVMIKREVLEQNKFDASYKHIEDYELWSRIAQLGKIANIQEDLLLYRWHDANVSVINAETQSNIKKEIQIRQLKRLDITPTEDELYAHNISFNLYHLGNKQELAVDKINEVEAWFTKLVSQNEKVELFPKEDFISYLWSRWCVLCFSQKKYTKALKPDFANYGSSTLFNLLKLLTALRKK